MPFFERYADWKQSLSYPGRSDADSPVHPVYIDLQLVRPVVDDRYAEHREARFEWILPETGTYRCTLDGELVEVPPGATLIVQPGERHCDHLAQGTAYYSCHFRLEGAARLFRPGTTAEMHRATIGNRDFADRTLRLLWSEACFLSEENYPVQSALFLALFRKILADYPPQILAPEFVQGAGDRFMAGRILAVFEANCRRFPGLDELCRATGMSRSTLARATQSLFGRPPLRAFLRHKLHRAAQQLLRQPTRPVGEISEEFGYPNQFQFSRAFHHEFGVSPRDYRKNG